MKGKPGLKKGEKTEPGYALSLRYRSSGHSTQPGAVIFKWIIRLCAAGIGR